jgi:hypothetical protein
MKKVFANWKMSLSALLLVGGLMIVSNSASAQNGQLVNPTTPDIKGAGTWVLESNALALLQGEMEGTIEQALSQLPSGGQQYIVWKYKAQLYSSVYGSISQGVSVSKAVRVQYDQLAGASHLEPVISPLSQTEWQAILNELVDLLSN